MSVEPAEHLDDSTLLPDNLLQYYNEIVNLVKTDCTFPSIGAVENDPTIQHASNQPSSNLTNGISPESSLPFPSSTSEQLGNAVALGNPSAFAPTIGDLSQSTMNPYELSQSFTLNTCFFEEPWISTTTVSPPKPLLNWGECGEISSLLANISTQHSVLKQHQSSLKQEQLNQHTDRLKEIIKETESIQSVRKANVFSTEVTEEEAEIIAQRIHLQQLQHSQYEKVELERKMINLLEIFPYYSREEVLYALSELKESEEDAMLKFGHADYLFKLRKDIAIKHGNNDGDSDYEDGEDEDEMDEEGERPTKLRKRRNGRSSQGSAGGSRKNRVYVCTGRLPLDEALANLEQDPNNPKVAMRGWSSARIRAYNCIKENPNAYYYRFNAPGESQVNGPWSREERERFLKRLSECGADGNWGIFATKIPGRVGYQCANFYRKLLSEGVVKDSSYYKDSWGKWHYRFSNGGGNVAKKRAAAKIEDDDDQQQQQQEEEDEVEAQDEIVIPKKPDPKSTKKKAKKGSSSGNSKQKSRKSQQSDVSNDEDDGGDRENVLNREKVDEIVTISRSMFKTKSSEEQFSPDNPLPGYIDPITLEEVKRPAISPYGHVMGYDSWLRCITQQSGDHKNVCPLTKKPLKKRELVLLTLENIDQYRDKIVM